MRPRAGDRALVFRHRSGAHGSREEVADDEGRAPATGRGGVRARTDDRGADLDQRGRLRPRRRGPGHLAQHRCRAARRNAPPSSSWAGTSSPSSRACGTPRWARRHRAPASTGSSQHLEVFNDAVDRWFEVRVYPNGQSLVVFFRDVHERRTLDEERAAESTSDPGGAQRAAVPNRHPGRRRHDPDHEHGVGAGHGRGGPAVREPHGRQLPGRHPGRGGRRRRRCPGRGRRAGGRARPPGAVLLAGLRRAAGRPDR